MDQRSLEEILIDYCIKGYFLFPIKPETKTPAIKNNLQDASNDINQLLKWAKKFPGCLWAISLAKSGRVAVDIDQKHGGMEYWEALVGANSEPQTLKAYSGGGGLHYVFLAEAGKKYRGKIKKANVTRTGIDVKHNGYIIVYPSIHPRTGKQYTWANELPETVAPEWVKKFIEKDADAGPNKSTFAKLEDGFFKRIIDQLKEKPFGYEEWNKFGMALHSWDAGEKGLALFLELTSGANFEPGDLEKARAKWDSYTKGGGITEGTLVRLARQMGCDIPNPNQWNDFDKFSKIEDEEMEEAPAWTEDDRGRQITVHPEFLVQSLNSEGYAVLTGESEGQLLKSFTNAAGILCVRLLTMENFKTSNKSYFLKWYKTLASGEKRAQFTPASDIWLQSKHKQTYTNIVFRKKGHKGELNLGGELPLIEAISGDVSLFEFLCTEIVADGDKKKGAYLMDWIADIFQNPWRKCFIVPVVIGEQGTGKGLLFEDILGALLGPYFNKVMTARVLKEKFNIEQSKKFFTLIDEATWRGDHEEMGVLKGLTGSKTIIIEEKFGGRYPLDNPSRYALLSNRKEAVHIEDSNRRFLTFDVSTKYTQKAEFFDKIYDQIQNGKLLSHILKFLLERDLSKFNAHVFPKELDTGGLETKLSGRGPIAQFWWNLLFEEPQKVFFKGRYLPKGRVFRVYMAHMKEINHWKRGETLKSFWDETKNIFKTLKEEGRDVVKKIDENKAERCFAIAPFEAAKDICNTFNISVPKSFDDLEFLTVTEMSEERNPSVTCVTNLPEIAH